MVRTSISPAFFCLNVLTALVFSTATACCEDHFGLLQTEINPGIYTTDTVEEPEPTDNFAYPEVQPIVQERPDLRTGGQPEPGQRQSWSPDTLLIAPPPARPPKPPPPPPWINQGLQNPSRLSPWGPKLPGPAPLWGPELPAWGEKLPMPTSRPPARPSPTHYPYLAPITGNNNPVQPIDPSALLPETQPDPIWKVPVIRTTLMTELPTTTASKLPLPTTSQRPFIRGPPVMPDIPPPDVEWLPHAVQNYVLSASRTVQYWRQKYLSIRNQLQDEVDHGRATAMKKESDLEAKIMRDQATLQQVAEENQRLEQALKLDALANQQQKILTDKASTEVNKLKESVDWLSKENSVMKEQIPKMQIEMEQILESSQAAYEEANRLEEANRALKTQIEERKKKELAKEQVSKQKKQSQIRGHERKDLESDQE